MRLTTGIAVAVTMAAATTHAHAQAGIPPTAPTAGATQAPSPVRTAPASRPNASAPHVSWIGAVLTIDANGANLVSVLREISRQTGMKVTGGIPDERVFGRYGPGSANAVIGDLVKGMGVNVLLSNGDAVAPKELVLTARTGGASPPQRTVQINDRLDDFDMPVQQDQRSQQGQPSPDRGQVPAQQGRGQTPLPNPVGRPGSAPPFVVSDGEVTGPVTAPPQTIVTGTENSDGSGTPVEPSGTRTPEQIFEELRRRQAQQNTNR